MTRSTVPLLAASLVAFAFTGSWAVAFTGDSSFGRLLRNDTIVGVRQHNVPCANLPDQATVRRLLMRNDAEVRSVESIGRGSVLVSMGDTQGRCPGKADILITYRLYGDGQRIHEAIGSDELFGIPYTLWNI